ncbi:unnamed protein product [Mytilus edulis]|uniref:C-type lectin domain-containing protein n=1 Tax=Mytilus edulis TaxID=6550 RepID=A0A8S3V6P7_MYTED|nr:unnamed protein product [Mytilus edulis]
MNVQVLDTSGHCRNRITCNGHQESCIAVESHVFNFKEGYKIRMCLLNSCVQRSTTSSTIVNHRISRWLASGIGGAFKCVTTEIYSCNSFSKNVCKYLCSRLVIISSKVENLAISQLLSQQRHQANRYWLDAYRNSSSFSGPWHWMSTGDILRRHTYSHWRPGSHDQTKPDGEHCASIGKG